MSNIFSMLVDLFKIFNPLGSIPNSQPIPFLTENVRVIQT